MTTYSTSNQPCAWFGTTQLGTSPWLHQKFTFDFNGNNIVNHKIMGSQDVNESIGYGQIVLNFAGLLTHSANSSSTINQTYPFSYFGQYSGRPIAVGRMTDDYSAPAPWYSSVGYVTSIHFENPTGYSLYKIPFQFGFIGTAYKTITCTDSGDHTNFTFSPGSGLGNGFFAGVRLSGTSPSSSGSSMGVSVIDTSTSTTIGLGPSLSLWTQFSSGITFPNSNSGIVLPIEDTSFNQSIQITSPADSYKLTFDHAFTSIPTVSVLYVQA